MRLGGQEILRDVTLEVTAGSWVCAIGPNGAGKTTLLHAVAGLVPFEGRADLWGRALSAYPRRERARLVALVPQVMKRWERRTAQEVGVDLEPAGKVGNE